MASFALALIIFMTLNSGRSSEVRSWLLGGALWSVYLVIYWIVHPLRIARQAKKIFKQQKSLQVPYECRITDETCFQKSEFGEARMAWSDFHKWKANDKLVLVYSSDRLFYMVPRRFFTSVEEYEQFKSVLTHAIGPMNRARVKMAS
jgi:YcxB-like protein